ncbi:L,D-transpeptidase [bacterium]|nr:L,D-transpeptidase [bacterium]
MKVSFSTIKYVIAGTLISGAIGASRLSAQPKTQSAFDTFEKTGISPKGCNNGLLPKNIPSPKIKINGQNKIAKFVVDLSQNVLYSYDNSGNVTNAYLVASGKKSTPTTSGVRVVSHIETYPYRTAPRRTKRRRNPRAYGPKIICLDRLDVKTGERSQIGEFIHGNNDSTSIGEYASKGCIRMDNEVIKELAGYVKNGDIVVILPNKN